MKVNYLPNLRRKIIPAKRYWFAGLIIFGIILIGGLWRLRTDYEHNLQPLSSSVVATSYFTVEPGSGLNQIANNLQSSGFIRSSAAFEWYVRSNELRDKLQAGIYSLSPSMSVSTIAQKIATGDIAKNLVTIVPGTRLDQVRRVLIKAGYSSSEADSALTRGNYSSNPTVAYIPAGHSLEGFLYPDSFQKNANTPARLIIGQSLNEMGDKLTPDILAGFKKQGVSVYQGVTLASIVEQESGTPEDAPTIAQVFLLRLHTDMALGSDVTARYAAAINGLSFSPTIDSPYNTRVVKGLPPSPIGSVTSTSLEAVAHPSPSHYLYFVTGDNGVTYFSYTEAQHEAFVKKYCIKGCQ